MICLTKRIDDFPEHAADDHADGQIDDISLQRERLEFLKQRKPVRGSNDFTDLSGPMAIPWVSMSCADRNDGPAES